MFQPFEVRAWFGPEGVAHTVHQSGAANAVNSAAASASTAAPTVAAGGPTASAATNIFTSAHPHPQAQIVGPSPFGWHPSSGPTPSSTYGRANCYSHYHRYGRRGPRIFPWLLLGGAGLYGYNHLKHGMNDLKDENYALRTALASATGGMGGAAAAFEVPRQPEPQSRWERRHQQHWGGRWGNAPPPAPAASASAPPVQQPIERI